MIITVPQRKSSRRVNKTARRPRVLRLIPVPRVATRRRFTTGRASDRVLRAPAAVGRVTGSGITGDRVPTMRSTGRNMTVTHTERFASVVTTSGNVEVRSYSLNPGVSTCFPWLSDVANRYEKYKFRMLEFHYIPQSAAAAGTVSLAFDFDPNDDPPNTMQQANTYHDYVTASIWAQNVKLRIDLQNGDRLPQKNTRPGLPGADLDLNVYDVGTLHVLTEGCAVSTIGYLEVSYVVDLFIHQVQAGVGGVTTATTGLDATNLVGTNQTPDAQAFIPFVASTSAVWRVAQPFEGLMVVRVNRGAGGLNADYAPVLSASGGVATVLYQYIDAGANNALVVIRLRTYVGATLTPTMTTGGAVTSISYFFASGDYDSYA